MVSVSAANIGYCPLLAKQEMEQKLNIILVLLAMPKLKLFTKNEMPVISGHFYFYTRLPGVFIALKNQPFAQAGLAAIF